MKMTHIQIREKFKEFWEKRDHKEIPPSPLTLKEDPTTLFNSSGMQPLIPYLTGQTHPLGKRVFDIQPSIRTQDIEEVGDDRHTTFFEMMGNWSFGDYYKKEQLPWAWQFFTEVLKLPKEKLYVSVFEGNELVPRDEESATIWKSLGIPEDHISYYGVTKNWWSRSGPPEKMPPGEIGGPDSEIFYEFDSVQHNPKFGKECHPNCDCGRFFEIGNSVFIQYRKQSAGSLEELSQKNVDYGGGLERILAAVHNSSDMFQTDLFIPIVHSIEQVFNKKYEDFKPSMQVIADHVKASAFLIKDGVTPSNKEHGYILRRLLRRASVNLHKLKIPVKDIRKLSELTESIISIYPMYFQNSDKNTIQTIINEEMERFSKTLERGIHKLQEYKTQNKTVDGKVAFDLYQSEGLPLEITQEILKSFNIEVDREQFSNEFNKHQNISRASSTGMFKGGLADTGEQTIKYHTATHLLHQALFDVLGQEVRQEGSNITAERLRFDFFAKEKPTDEQMKKVAEIVNKKIQEELPMQFEMMPKDQALHIGAKSFFKEKYPDTVKVYYIGKTLESAYSKEFCGGPHVKNTKEIGSLAITKLEKIGSNLYRIYAK